MYHCSSLVKYLAEKLTRLTFGQVSFIYTVHFSGMQKSREKSLTKRNSEQNSL